MIRETMRCAMLAAAGMLPQVVAAQGADFPVPAAQAGRAVCARGIADILSRVIAQPLSAHYGRPVVVENRSGSAGHVGAAAVVGAPADGYTLMLGTIAHNAAYAMYSNLSYDPANGTEARDTRRGERRCADRASVGAGEIVAEFVALAKAKPGALAYGSAGHGSALHMAAELFMYMSGTKLTHVPYRGSAPAMADLLGGRRRSSSRTSRAGCPTSRRSAFALSVSRR